VDRVGRAVAGEISGFGAVEGDFDPVVSSTIGVAFAQSSLGERALSQFCAAVCHTVIVALMGRMAIVVLVNDAVGDALVVLDSRPLRLWAKAIQDDFGGFLF
jgi:hypothetical protein